MKLPVYEKKIRIRVGKRVTHIKKKYVPQTDLVKKLLDIWLQIEKIWRKK